MAHNIVIFDTSIFIDHLRTNKYYDRIPYLHALVRNSSVVLSELLRGATQRDEIEFIRELSKNHPILTPTEQNWLDSGELLSRINREKGYTPEKLRDLHFDVLIALTARNVGATIITSNKSDFGLIQKFKHFKFELW